jgi:hypothetical protein
MISSSLLWCSFSPITQQVMNTRPVMDATETEELEKKFARRQWMKLQVLFRRLKISSRVLLGGAAALAGSGVGAAASFGALYTLGTTGVSAAGITSGLATALLQIVGGDKLIIPFC